MLAPFGHERSTCVDGSALTVTPSPVDGCGMFNWKYVGPLGMTILVILIGTNKMYKVPGTNVAFDKIVYIEPDTITY